MKFTVLEPDGKGHEFVLTRDKLGQEALDKVRSTRNAELANEVSMSNFLRERPFYYSLTPYTVFLRSVRSWESKRKIISVFDTLLMISASG